MTGTVAILLAICAGLVVHDRRGMVWALALPYGIVAVLQTVGLAAGLGVNPPSTVTGWPGAISYYVVQLIIFAVALGVAEQLRRLRATSRADAGSSSEARTATMANLGIAAALVAAWLLDRGFFDPGNVHTHSGNGNPPLPGVLGMGALLVAFLALTAVTVWRYARRSRAMPQGVSARS